MSRDELARRRRQSAAVAVMMLRICRALRTGYRPSRSISLSLPEILCGMAIRANDTRRRPPCGIATIAAATGLPRNSVKRYLRPLLDNGVILRIGQGYAGADDHLRKRIGSRYFKRIMAAIRSCADILDKLDK